MEKLSITVTDEHARRIREKVDDGDFASASEVIRSALNDWQRADDARYERQIDSIRKRVQAAIDNPVRHSSEDMRKHISELAQQAIPAAKQRTGTR